MTTTPAVADTAGSKFDATSIPSAQSLTAAASSETVFDSTGQKVAFGDLYKDQKTIVIWIRHFHCGMCQDYLSAIVAQVKPEVLSSSNVKLLVIGCGEWGLIKPYAELLEFPYPIYADPEKKTYSALGMTLRILDRGPEESKPSYVKHSFIGGVVSSLGNAFKMGKFLGAGDIKQLGGEFVLGPGNTCSYARRMQNTRDHTEVKELMKLVGIEL